MDIDRERTMKISTLFRGAATAVLLSGAGAVPVLADDNRIDDAWKAALMENDGLLNEQQQAAINGIAYASAAALLCDGIDIDPDKVAKETTEVLSGGPKDLSEEDEFQRYTAIMLMLGTAKGIILAEGALHKAEFCANAMKEKADTEVANFWK